MRNIFSRVLPILVLLTALPSFAYLTPQQYYDPGRKLLIKVANTKWDFFSPDDKTSQTTSSDLHLQFVARSPEVYDGNLQPTLTMRIDTGKWTSAQSYAERWLKDFPKYGYELQLSRQNQYGNLKGYEIELTAAVDQKASSKRRARQFIVQRPTEMWIFTCSTEESHFHQAWTACEKILRTATVH